MLIKVKDKGGKERGFLPVMGEQFLYEFMNGHFPIHGPDPLNPHGTEHGVSHGQANPLGLVQVEDREEKL